ncbi:hypothetical protein O3Q52_01990 [Streptomyces sp. ActVer]|uniref:hypothetical protein n=1 Tax=Streptomyces sp. ActVer TaxID=3014558 RepID=UPI0022B421CA|nr:hypothetical protein [Streptomyces sp. ActVer]MCZ4506999.1 hypothetical protein [Streptomyces sp. ActVer]
MPSCGTRACPLSRTRNPVLPPNQCDDSAEADDAKAAANTSTTEAASSDSSDTTARVLGVVGIVVGVAGVAFGVLAGRRRTTA